MALWPRHSSYLQAGVFFAMSGSDRIFQQSDSSSQTDLHLIFPLIAAVAVSLDEGLHLIQQLLGEPHVLLQTVVAAEITDLLQLKLTADL